MSQLLDDLRDARAKITDPEKWIKEAWFKTTDGMLTADASKDICCMCAVGAVACVTGYNPEDDDTIEDEREEQAFNALIYAAVELFPARACIYAGIAEFNDRSDTTHKEILAVFDRAIVNEENKNA